MPAGRFRFGEFEFDAGSGEVHRRHPTNGDRVHRLPPQPARLLALLVERGGGLLGRDEIRDRIWPDVEVDFDTSLHFCIRQIREALGDSATDARYVETLPRRGYRLVPPVEPLGAEGSEPRPGASRIRRWRIGLLAGLPVAGLLWWLAGPGPAPPTGAPVRIGVMPFVPPEGTTAFGPPTSIGDWVLDGLTVGSGERARIVGPTTTAAYADARALRTLVADFDLDYVVNGRFIDSEDGPRMLAELIRASDGAHIWVKPYDDLSAGRRIGSEISRAVLSELRLAP